jgi:hypothetical protein
MAAHAMAASLRALSALAAPHALEGGRAWIALNASTWVDAGGNLGCGGAYPIACDSSVADPWEMSNGAAGLPPGRRAAMHTQLTALRTCEGSAACTKAGQ